MHLKLTRGAWFVVRGAFGVVKLGISKADGSKYALKMMKRSKSRPEFLKNELEVLRLVGDHPNIVGFHGAYELSEEVTLVLELCVLGGARCGWHVLSLC